MLYQVNKHIDESFKTFENGLGDLLEGSVSDSYYKTIYDIHKFTGVGTTFAFVDKEMIEEIMTEADALLSGRNYTVKTKQPQGGCMVIVHEVNNNTV